MAREKLSVEFLKSLQPGSELAVADCEQMTGYSLAEHPQDYQFHLMILSKDIERELARMGRVWTVRAIDSHIVVLDHAESSKYNQQAFLLGRRKMYRANKRLRGVNVAELTAEETAAHDKAIMRQAAIMSAIKTQEHTPIEATVRTVPTMRPR